MKGETKMQEGSTMSSDSFRLLVAEQARWESEMKSSFCRGAHYTSAQIFGVLNAARRSKGMTQQQVADAARIHLRHYQMFEGGKRDLANASFRIVFAICKALDIDPEEILRDAVDE